MDSRREEIHLILFIRYDNIDISEVFILGVDDTYERIGLIWSLGWIGVIISLNNVLI